MTIPFAQRQTKLDQRFCCNMIQFWCKSISAVFDITRRCNFSTLAPIALKLQNAQCFWGSLIPPEKHIRFVGRLASFPDLCLFYCNLSKTWHKAINSFPSVITLLFKETLLVHFPSFGFNYIPQCSYLSLRTSALKPIFTKIKMASKNKYIVRSVPWTCIYSSTVE